MPPVLIPKAETAAQAQSQSLYVDLGRALAGGMESSLGSLLGGGLGGAVMINGSPSAQSYNITLSGIQNMMSQIAVGTSASSVYTVGVDAAVSGSWNGISVVSVPNFPQGQLGYVYPSYSLRYPDPPAEFPTIPQEVFQYQTYVNRQMNWISGAMGAYSSSYGSETPEQRIAREEADVKRRAARSAAEKRAEQLMFTILKPSQVRQYEENGWFETEIDDRLYRIHKRSHSANVELMVKGKPIAKYCAHPANAYETPIADTMLSQLLALQTDEKRFLAIANKTVIHHP
jgi:hypothetical protein